jgi:hypothetical protein
MFLARVARPQKALDDDAPPAIRLHTHATALRSAGEHPKAMQEVSTGNHGSRFGLSGSCAHWR